MLRRDQKLAPVAQRALGDADRRVHPPPRHRLAPRPGDLLPALDRQVEAGFHYRKLAGDAAESASWPLETPTPREQYRQTRKTTTKLDSLTLFLTEQYVVVNLRSPYMLCSWE